MVCGLDENPIRSRGLQARGGNASLIAGSPPKTTGAYGAQDRGLLS